MVRSRTWALCFAIICSPLSHSTFFKHYLIEKIPYYSYYSSKCAAAERFMRDDCGWCTIFFCLFKINNNVTLLPYSNWEIRRSEKSVGLQKCYFTIPTRMLPSCVRYCQIRSCVRSARKGDSLQPFPPAPVLEDFQSWVSLVLLY